jgi:PAS domain S-box-containing protein/diguanylate cyclase (GGDEF)-like protein
MQNINHFLVEQRINKENKNILISSDIMNDDYKKFESSSSSKNYNSFVSNKIQNIKFLFNSLDISLLIIDMKEDYLKLLKSLSKTKPNLFVAILVEKISNEDLNIIKDLNFTFFDIIKTPLTVEELTYKIDTYLEIQNKLFVASSEHSLLNQYKETIDKYSIVSKTDTKGVITYVNDKFCKISGYKSNELLGKPHKIIRHEDMSSQIFKTMWHTIKDLKQVWKGKIKNKKKDGSHYWVDTIINPILDSDGKIIEYIALRTDITELEKRKEFLKKQFNITYDKLEDVNNISKIYEETLDKTTIILRLSKDLKILHVNELFCETFGYTKEELIGRDHHDLFPSEIKKEFILDGIKIIKEKGFWKGQLKGLCKNGDIKHFITTVVPLKDKNDNILEFMVIRVDITKVVQYQKEKEFLLSYDELTKLKGRNALNNDLKNKKGTLLLIDIIDFKKLNSLIGYEGADEILISVANLLKEESKLTYRLYGDIFAVFYENEKIEYINTKAIDLMLKFESHKFIYDNFEIPVSINIGISDTVPYLLTAEEAISRNKKSFNKIARYNYDINEKTSDFKNLDMLIKIKDALENDNIVPYFQAIVSLETKEVVKYESLVRLIDEKENKIISPYEFLEISKKSKMYSQITKNVLRKSIEFLKSTNIPISINISFEDLINSDVLNYIAFLLQCNEKIANLITFEILESSEIKDYEQINLFINLVRKYNCKVAIDDFGSGYSNFTQLLNMKPDIIKIDGSLIKNIDKDINSRNIVESILILAKKSQIKTVAEFIDNKKVHNVVKELGIDYGQGFYYAKPEDLMKK